MQTVRVHTFGKPAVIDDVSVPALGPGEVLVRVSATALNPLDTLLISGEAAQFFPITLPYAVGIDFAGTVESVSADVQRLKSGDRVIGYVDALKGGALSEYVVVPTTHCTPLPNSLTMEEGASLPTAGSSAFHALFSVGHLQAGETVLIHAGAGGVGTFAIQFAKMVGAKVITTASGTGLDLAKSLGADGTIDYPTQDFASSVSNLDLVLDLVGGDVQDRSFKTLKSGGRLVTLKNPPDQATATRHGVSASVMYAAAFMPRLGKVVDAVVDNGIKPIIDQRFAFTEFNQALSAQALGRARGKIVVSRD